MKKIFTLILSIFLITSYAQETCDEFENNFESTINFWDWTDSDFSNWEVYHSSSNLIQVLSPFEAPSSSIQRPNVEHLYLGFNTRDHLPEEGWELIIKNFGVGFGPGESVSNPSFILYNRFRGIMRVFFGIVEPDGEYSGALINMEFQSDIESALLTNGVSISTSLDKFLKDVKLNIPNTIKVESNFTWLMADIPVAYDPCTCTSSLIGSSTEPNISIINCSARFLEESSFSADLNEITPSENVVQAGSSFKPEEVNIWSEFEKILNFATDASKQGSKVEGTISDAVNATQDILNNSNDLTNYLVQEEYQTDINWPKWFTDLPGQVGFAGGVLEFLVTGGKSSNEKENSSTPIVPRKYSIDDGQIVKEGLMDGITFYTPGSPHDNIQNQEGLKPIYDYTLGVFNLLEQPQLEWASYAYDGVSGLKNAVLPHIVQLRLKEPLKYVINPASELEVIDFKVAIEYQLKPNVIDQDFWDVDTSHFMKTQFMDLNANFVDFYYPMIGPIITNQTSNSQTYKERLETNGINIASWPKVNKNTDDPMDEKSAYNLTYSTDFFNASCYGNYSILLPTYENRVKTGFENNNFLYEYWGPNYRVRNNTYVGAFLGNEGIDFFNFNNPNENFYDIKIKVKLILRRTDQHADENTEDIILIQSYEPNIVEEPSSEQIGYYYLNTISDFDENWTYGVDYFVDNLSGLGPNKPFFPIGEVDYPYNLLITNQNIFIEDTIIYAKNNIYILNSQYATNGAKVIFRAGNEVMVNGEVEIRPYNSSEIQTQISNALPGCDVDIILDQTPFEVVMNFCEKGAYNPQAEAKTSTLKEDEIEVLNANSLVDIISINPNPFGNNLQVEFELETTSEVTFTLYDIQGRLIKSLESGFIFESGSYVENYTIDREFEAGVYIFKYCIDGECHNLQLIHE